MVPSIPFVLVSAARTWSCAVATTPATLAHQESASRRQAENVPKQLFKALDSVVATKYKRAAWDENEVKAEVGLRFHFLGQLLQLIFRDDLPIEQVHFALRMLGKTRIVRHHANRRSFTV